MNDWARWGRREELNWEDNAGWDDETARIADGLTSPNIPESNPKATVKPHTDTVQTQSHDSLKIGSTRKQTKKKKS